jgi:hypothetical protein
MKIASCEFTPDICFSLPIAFVPLPHALCPLPLTLVVIRGAIGSEGLAKASVKPR